MTAPAVQTTPQFYTIDDVAALLRADFADRSTLATVDADEWGPEKLRGQPLVVISYETGEITEPAGHYQPGVNLDVTMPDGTAAQARPLLDVVPMFVFRIHAPAAGGRKEGAAAGGRRATDQLMRQTLRALRRNMAGPFRGPGSVEWPGKTDPDVLGYEAFVYGSLCRVRIPIASPVADDAYATGTVTELETDYLLSVDGGATFTPSDFSTQPVPPP